MGGEHVKARTRRVDTVEHRWWLKEQLACLTEGRVAQQRLPACSTCIFPTVAGKDVNDQGSAVTVGNQCLEK